MFGVCVRESQFRYTSMLAIFPHAVVSNLFLRIINKCKNVIIPSDSNPSANLLRIAEASVQRTLL